MNKIPIYFYHQTFGDLLPHRDWLHPREIHFLKGLKFEKRRHDWLLGRWTAKDCVISFFEKKGIALSPSSFAILKKESGAPELFFEKSELNCQVSLSHRAGHAIAAVAPAGVAIGCDLEKVEPRSEAFLSDYFLERELAFLSPISPGEKDVFSNLIWSVKEAVMKATGQGMKLHPRKIEVGEIENGRGWQALSVDTSSVRFQGLWKVEGEMIFVIVSNRQISVEQDF